MLNGSLTSMVKQAPLAAKFMAWALVGLMLTGCPRTPGPDPLPEPATGPFLPRLMQGWTLEAVSYEGNMPNPFDSTTIAHFKGDADSVTGFFNFETINDTDVANYHIDFLATFLLGATPIHYLNSGTGIYDFDSLSQVLWFYDYPDTLEFHVDLDAETLQLWHSFAPIRDDSTGLDVVAKLNVRLIR